LLLVPPSPDWRALLLLLLLLPSTDWRSLLHRVIMPCGQLLLLLPAMLLFKGLRPLLLQLPMPC
jgi:hypothetical protein